MAQDELDNLTNEIEQGFMQRGGWKACRYLLGKLVGRLERERDRLQQWVHDCQAGMYINCVYCGHRYGPDDEVPATMADVLKEHIEQCPQHPMSALKIERDDLARALFRIRSLTMRGKGDKQVADIACGAVLSIDETPLFSR